MLKTIVAAFAGFVMAAGSAMAQCTIPNTLTNGTNADATQVMANFNALLTCLNNLPTATPAAAQGRLTLVSTAPVMTSSQTGKTVVYYTPYVGNQVPIYNGTVTVSTPFTELSNITTNAGTGNAGPAAVVANSNYDLFVWSSAGTVTLTRGPAWTSDTARGTGAGTTELQRVGGILTNAVAITNGPAANRGTYVGSVRSDGSAQLNWQPGAIDTPALLNVWNAYNRRVASGFIGDSTNSWNYTTSTVRAAGGVNTVRVSFLQGLQEDFFSAQYSALAFNGGGNVNVAAGIGYDATSAFSGRPGFITANATQWEPASGSHRVQALGFHFMQACEWSFATGTSQWVGDNGTPTVTQTGLSYLGLF